MDWINIANLTINTLLWITTIILGVFVYTQTNRNTNKQIETDKKIADMQKEMHDKDLKANMLEKRMECYEYVHRTMRFGRIISDASPVWTIDNTSFYEFINKVSFTFDDILDFDLYEGKINGIYSRSISQLISELKTEFLNISDQIARFKAEYNFSEIDNKNDDDFLNRLRINTIRNSNRIVDLSYKALSNMSNELKVN
ncbi:hypothetical protein [Anaerorhabdus sp.]|uniref:hypothetical protein n=1 Tax=Anaerorhabdus sp. TaxID=1872524 RepID=UPI002FC79903